MFLEKNSDKDWLPVLFGFFKQTVFILSVIFHNISADVTFDLLQGYLVESAQNFERTIY